MQHERKKQALASGVLSALSPSILWGFVTVYIYFFAVWAPGNCCAPVFVVSCNAFRHGDVATANQRGNAGFRQQKTTCQFYDYRMFFIGKLDSLCVCGGAQRP